MRAADDELAPDLRVPLVDLGAGRKTNLWLLAAVVLVALALRTWGIGYPDSTIFDETFYAIDAYGYLGGTPELGQPGDPVKIANEAQWEHPPLGKLLIAAGEGSLGFGPVGWRLPAVVFGTAGVAIVFLVGLALFERTSVAFASACLTALDGLHIVQSRVAMLDIFAVFFVTSALFGMVLHRRTGSRRCAIWGGLAFGAAVACKWSMLAFGPVVALIFFSTTRRSVPRGSRARQTVLVLITLPLLVYIGSYAQFWVQHGPALRDFVELQSRMFDRLHHGVAESATKPPDETIPVPTFASGPWEWPLLVSPIEYFRSDDAPPRQVVALGNPVLWWGWLIAVPAVVASVVRRRDAGMTIVVGGYLSAWAPWLLVGRPTYSYYLVAGVPFMALGVAGTVASLHPPIRRPVALLAAALTVAVAVAFWPKWTGAPAPPWSDALQWLPSWP
jgi:dolichyl-phosphate-mannose-protein mannosyltransferase